MGQSIHTGIVQSRRLTFSGHIARMDDNADAKKILSTVPDYDWRRPREHPHMTWCPVQAPGL